MSEPTDDLTALRSVITRSQAFDVDTESGHLRLARRRRVPSRGFLRLFVFPRVVVRVRPPRAAPSISVRPDALGWFMGVVCVGGVFFELTSSRITYPREYPPEFVYAVSAIYLVSLLVELWLSRRAIRSLFTDAAR